MNLILDSGAYSAWTKKTPINLKEYCQFALDNLSVFDYIVNLDMIPGEYGRQGTDKERETSAALGYQNYWYMIGQGVPKHKLIHVFHQDENFFWLNRMVQEMEYIGLSPANDRNTQQKRDWLDNCMHHVCKSDGYPKIKFHAFGVTSIQLLRKYPWFSADSSSWMAFSKFGAILVPKSFGRERDYSRNPYTIFLSLKSPKTKMEGRHFFSLSKIEQERVVQYIHEKGFNLGASTITDEGEETIIQEGLMNNGLLRDQINMMFYMDFAKSLPKWPWRYRHNGQQGLF